MVSRIRLLAVTLVLAVCFCSASATFLLAKAGDTTSLKGLTLSPLRTELDIAPGTAVDKQLAVTNATAGGSTVDLSAEVFRVTDPEYDYAFSKESEISKWASFATPSIKLAAGERRSVNYHLGVPLGTEPGGYYIALLASTTTEATRDGAADTEQRVASLLYITVAGDVSRSGSLVGLTLPVIVGGSNNLWSMTVQDSGSAHFRSNYTIKILNAFGGTVRDSINASALILPGSVRRVSDSLPLPDMPGLYQYVYDISLGDSGSVTQTRWVLYITPLLGIVILTVLFILAMAGRELYKKHHQEV